MPLRGEGSCGGGGAPGIPSPPLAVFVVMLSKAHLSSHSRRSGSRSVITPSLGGIGGRRRRGRQRMRWLDGITDSMDVHNHNLPHQSQEDCLQLCFKGKGLQGLGKRRRRGDRQEESLCGAEDS